MKLKTLIPLQSIGEGLDTEQDLDKQRFLSRLKKEFTGLICVYYFSDPHMGWGNAGTYFYCKVKESDFEMADYGGWIQLTADAKQRLKRLGYEHMTHNWKWAKPADQKKEADQLKKQYDRISKIKSI